MLWFIRFKNKKLLRILLLFFRNLIFWRMKGERGEFILFSTKHDPCIYYIGRTNKLLVRFKSHLKQKLNDRFHVLASIVGWENFELSAGSLRVRLVLYILYNLPTYPWYVGECAQSADIYNIYKTYYLYINNSRWRSSVIDS